jgi:hypothetical protein
MHVCSSVLLLNFSLIQIALVYVISLEPETQLHTHIK